MATLVPRRGARIRGRFHGPKRWSDGHLGWPCADSRQPHDRHHRASALAAHTGRTMDPLSGSAWSAPGTVAGFADSPPNPTLMRFAEAELARGAACALDVGCGAGRNTIPLAEQGWRIVGVDLLRPMIEAAARRVESGGMAGRVRVALGSMDALPIGNR